MTAPTLPSNVQYGQVVGRFLLAVADGADPDSTPDAQVPDGLTVTFTPAPGWMLNAAASPSPVTIVPTAIVCNLDSDGYLVDSSGNRGVYLVATDDPDLNPSGWTYLVTIRSATVSSRSWSIAVPAGGVVDLTATQPVSGSTGNAIVVGPAMVLGSPVNTSTDLPVTGASGEAHMALDTGHIWSWSGTQWVDGGPISGADGVGIASATVDGSGDLTLTLTDSTTLGPWHVAGAPGDPGSPGTAATVAVGSVTTGAAGSAAAVTNSGTPSAAVLDFDIPRGDPGAPGDPGSPGPANSLSIGTVTQGAAAATITGTAPSQTLNLTLPKGDPGSPGDPTAFELRGTGSPYGVITPASAGVYYTDTAATNGAIRWVSTGTTNTSWIVVVGDTGWRNVAAGTAGLDGWVSGEEPSKGTTNRYALLTRVGSLVTVQMRGQASNTYGGKLLLLSAGFRPRAGASDLFASIYTSSGVFTNLLMNGDYLAHVSLTGTPSLGVNQSWLTSDPWPTTLPGLPG